MELIVTEKPKVANRIAYILGKGKAKQKSHNQVYYYEFERDGKKVVVAPAVGHLFNLTEKSKSYDYPVFDIEWVPNYKISKSAYYSRNYIKTLEQLSKDADEFTCACDYDIEGSLIGGNVFKHIYKKGNGKRMKFSSLTPMDIEYAYRDKEKLDVENIEAGEARHTLDWYYGINLSRALMSALKRSGAFRVMSIGRVQGPALELLVELEKEIKKFVPEPYWELYIILNKIKFLHEKGRFTDENKATDSLKNTGENAKIEKVEKEEKELWPLPPYDLTSLQIDAYRIFKFAPSRTLEIAQSLYENSLISYPRTSSQKLPSKLGLSKIIEKLKMMKDYEKEAGKIIENQWFKPMQGSKDDPAHPAIHPTGVNAKKSTDELKLYDLIVRRFLSCFGPKAKKEIMNITANSNGEKYKVSGSRIVEKGWIEFYGKYFYGKDVILPEFIEGKEEKIEDKQKEKKDTKPPRRYTAATVLSELEKRKLGTKATRATILDRLYDRSYIFGSSIEVTDFGIKVESILEKYAPTILDQELTRKTEDQMELIEAGKLGKEEVIKEGKEILEKVLAEWKKNEAKIGGELGGALRETEKEQTIVGTCEKCKGDLRIIKLKLGKQFIGCSGYPNCRNAYPLPGGALIKPTKDKCKECEKPKVLVIKTGRKYAFCIDPNCVSKKNWGKKKTVKKTSAPKTKEKPKPKK